MTINNNLNRTLSLYHQFEFKREDQRCWDYCCRCHHHHRQQSYLHHQGLISPASWVDAREQQRFALAPDPSYDHGRVHGEDDDASDDDDGAADVTR